MPLGRLTDTGPSAHFPCCRPYGQVTLRLSTHLVDVLPTRPLSTMVAQLPIGQSGGSKFHDVAATQRLRTEFRMFEETANPVSAFGWRFAQYDHTIVFMTELAAKKSNVSCEEGHFPRPLKMAEDFLGVVPFGPTYLISDLLAMDSPAPE